MEKRQSTLSRSFEEVAPNSPTRHYPLFQITSKLIEKLSNDFSIHRKLIGAEKLMRNNPMNKQIEEKEVYLRIIEVLKKSY
ncbi:hypothetical protein B1F79_00975 [Coxiella-like endosymbiont of Rhipicephalus sanguineus]|nr:hypothetical protein [Coxiella-like endosymbiont of Rhipicephalus sanguineus]